MESVRVQSVTFNFHLTYKMKSIRTCSMLSSKAMSMKTELVRNLIMSTLHARFSLFLRQKMLVVVRVKTIGLQVSWQSNKHINQHETPNKHESLIFSA